MLSSVRISKSCIELHRSGSSMLPHLKRTTRLVGGIFRIRVPNHFVVANRNLGTTDRTFDNLMEPYNATYSDRSASASLDLDGLEKLINAEMAVLRTESDDGVKNEIKAEELVGGIVNLYNRWWSMLKDSETRGRGRIRPRNSQIFELVLEACSEHHPRAAVAQQVLENFDEMFGSDIENKPTRKHYDQLLLAYADDRKCSQASALADDVIHMMEKWSFTMKPILETYLLACRCMSKELMSMDNDVDTVLCANMSNLLSKAFPLLEERNIDHMDDGTLLLCFRSLSDSIESISHITSSPESSTPSSTFSVVAQAIRYWLSVTLDHRLPGLWKQQSAGFKESVERTARHILKLFESNMPKEDCQSASNALVDHIENLLGKKFLQVEANKEIARRNGPSYHRGTQLPLNMARVVSVEKEEVEQELPTTCIEKENHMIAVARMILDVPVGTMEAEHWKNAEEVIIWLSRQTSEDFVKTSFDLLARFVDEATTRKDSTEKLALIMEKRNVMELLSTWYSLWNEKETHWTPKQVTSLINRLVGLGILQLNRRTVTILMNASMLRSNPSEAAEKVDEAFDDFLAVSSQDQSNPQVMLFLVNGVLDVWSNSGRRDTVQRAERVLSMAEESWICSYLDISAYNAMLDVYSKGGCAEEAESMLTSLVERWNENPEEPKPNVASIESTVTAWVRSGYEHSPERSTNLLLRLKESQVLEGLSIELRTRTFNNVLACWAKSGREDAGEQTHKLLVSMKDGTGDALFRPDNVSYSIVVQALAKSGKPEMAEKVLVELCELYDMNNDRIMRPNTGMFTDVLSGWMKSDSPERMERMHVVFDLVYDLYEKGTLLRGSGQDSLAQLHHLMFAAIVSSDRGDGARRADEFLGWMKYNWGSDPSKFKPDGVSYSYVICGYLDAIDGVENVQRAEELLYEAFLDDSIFFEIATPARVVLALAKDNKARAADAWLHRIFDACEKGYFGEEGPSVSLVGGVLASWFRVSKSDKEAGARAERLVQRFAELKKKGIAKEGLDPKARRLIPFIWIRSARDEKGIDRACETIQHMHQVAREGQTEMYPDVAMYNTAILAYAELDEPNAEKAESVLRELLEDHRLNANQRAMPDVECFNNVLKAWAETKKSKSLALERADSLLREMTYLFHTTGLDVAPNRNSYHFVMSLCAQHGTGMKMKDYFEAMRNHFSNTDQEAVRPTGLSYRYVIKKLSQEGIPEEAEAYLRDFCEQHRVGRIRSPPSGETFNFVIKAWQKHRNRTQQQQYSGNDHVPQDDYGMSSKVSDSVSHDSFIESRVQNLRSLKEKFWPGRKN